MFILYTKDSGAGGRAAWEGAKKSKSVSVSVSVRLRVRVAGGWVGGLEGCVCVRRPEVQGVRWSAQKSGHLSVRFLRAG